MYDTNSVSRIAEEVTSKIEIATFNGGAWDEVPAAISKAFPGSFGGLYNMNFEDRRVNLWCTHNMDPDFKRSYAEHFAYINPWTEYWSSVGNGIVALSEDVSPARRFSHTEFYNDWLAPQKDVEAAVGVKIVGDRGESIQYLMHFPVRLSGAYGKPAAEILNRVRGPLQRSISLARQLRYSIEGATAEAAIVERSRCAAFVIDSSRSVREANPLAEQLFSTGQPVVVHNRQCFLTNREADSRLSLALDKLSNGQPVEGSHIAFRTETGVWVVTLAALPTPRYTQDLSSLLRPRQMVLVICTELQSGEAGDFSTLAAAFGLEHFMF